MISKKLLFVIFTIGILFVTGVVLIIVFVNEPEESFVDDHNAKNIIFILADDMGWSDIGYANGEAYTPTLDKLAKEGVILNQSYMYSMCTPSRSSLLSGIFAEKLGMQHYVISNENAAAVGIPHNIDLIPKYLKPYGFKSHLVGKWHVGSCSLDYTPVNRGFDSFYGFFYGETDYYTHRTSYFNNTSGLDFWDQTSDKLDPVLDKNGTYSTYAFNQRITQIIDSHDKSKPLFLFYAAQNPHKDDDYNVPKWYEEKFMDIADESRRRIIAMTYLLDESVFNITKDLERNGMLKDTIIVFSSDNGGHVADHQRNYPLRGSKSTVFEGGHRVRSFIHVQGLAGSVYEGMFHAVDWLPTIIAAALNEPNSPDLEGIDGKNQWGSILNNQESKRNSFIYNIDKYGSRFQNRCELPTEAIRLNEWKLIRGCPGHITGWYNTTDFNPSYDDLDVGIDINGSRYFLFNLKSDPNERENLAGEMTEKLRELEILLEEYKKVTVEPQVKEPLEKYRDPKGDPALWGDKFSPGWC